MQILRLGTRRSLLATTQSRWVASTLEDRVPGLKIELVGIDTQGDQIVDIPLRQAEGKEFFVAELDHALVTGKVDFTIHSMKDLSLDRPAEIVLAATPARENLRDVIVWGPGVCEKIRAGRVLKIGTSAPRRLENLPALLSRILPRFPGAPAAQLQWEEIRGNVNTRLGRIHEAPNSERFLDAVVLALAGLNRLCADPSSKSELTALLRDVNWTVLPLRECPSAPAQGALAIECRRSESDVRAILGQLHDEATARAVARERKILQEWGGGCHQAMGASCVAHPVLGELFFVKGKKPDGALVHDFSWQMPQRPSGYAQPWDGTQLRSEFSSNAVAMPELATGTAVFLAHSRALPDAWVGNLALRACRLWVSGTKSWQKLAEKGLWVEGSAEGFGFDWIAPTLTSSALGLPRFDDWLVLTHQGATDGWQKGKVVATYKVMPHVPADLAQVTHLFWSSTAQFEAHVGRTARGAFHSCGPGKTADAIIKHGVTHFAAFPSVEEWRKWVGIGGHR